MRFLFFIFTFVLLNNCIFGQTPPFNLYLEPVTIDGLEELQSYAFGQHDGKWLIVGGRTDGLHRRQPFAAFEIAGHNNQLIVIDPIAQQKWTAPLSSLPAAIQEQLSSTNMQYYQEGDYLYCVGGYGYSPTIDDHTTYSFLTAIKISDVIGAIINNTDFTSYFRQLTDPAFQVTGGRLHKIYDTYYLLGGQKFIGRYNPMGPTHGPGFVQEYTNAIRRFTLADDGTAITISHLPPYTDSLNLHRRDYNAEPQILPNGQEGITMFSGVFQPAEELPFLPFLNSVTVDSSGYTTNNDFQQFYNHYHCPTLPLYSEINNEMHTVFFGGIAQYYDSLSVLVQDNNVPFVKTIARVTRDANGNMAEYKLPIEMPALMGAGAAFIPNKDIAHYSNDVIRLDQITADSTLVGYIYGGISSTQPNVFWINTGVESHASSQIFRVYLTTNTALAAIHDLNEQSNNTLKMQVYPNPNNGDFIVKFTLAQKTNAKISLYNIKGKKIDELVLDNLNIGENKYQKKIKNLYKGGVYIVTLETPYEKTRQKIIVAP